MVNNATWGFSHINREVRPSVVVDLDAIGRIPPSNRGSGQGLDRGGIDRGKLSLARDWQNLSEMRR